MEATKQYFSSETAYASKPSKQNHSCPKILVQVSFKQGIRKIYERQHLGGSVHSEFLNHSHQFFYISGMVSTVTGSYKKIFLCIKGI